LSKKQLAFTGLNGKHDVGSAVYKDLKNVEASKLLENADANIPPSWDSCGKMCPYLLLKIADDECGQLSFLTCNNIHAEPVKRRIAFARIQDSHVTAQKNKHESPLASLSRALHEKIKNNLNITRFLGTIFETKPRQCANELSNASSLQKSITISLP
jgi:hypothetical protein